MCATLTNPGFFPDRDETGAGSDHQTQKSGVWTTDFERRGGNDGWRRNEGEVKLKNENAARFLKLYLHVRLCFAFFVARFLLSVLSAESKILV